jgi:hypothetical protein
MSDLLAGLLAVYAGTCGFVAGWRIRERIGGDE